MAVALHPAIIEQSKKIDFLNVKNEDPFEQHELQTLLTYLISENKKLENQLDSNKVSLNTDRDEYPLLFTFSAYKPQQA
jgi:hypothetical protein